jgi:hypothetical protein
MRMLVLSQHGDQTLGCAHCGESFVFSAGERELLRLRGVLLTPDRCPPCKAGLAKLPPRARRTIA